MFRRQRLEGKTPDQLRSMRAAGLLVGRTLELLRSEAVAGRTTGDLDGLAESFIRDGGGVPSFLGYPGAPGAPDFPGSLCLSVNDEIVHGLPSSRELRDGDLLSIDCGAIVDGWHGDAAISVVVGGTEAGTPETQRLLRITEDSMWAGAGALRVGGRLYDVGAAVEDCVEAAAAAPVDSGGALTLGIVEEYTGHGIGTRMHMDPEVYNYRVQGRSPIVVDGLTICIEPMVTLGSAETRTLDDGWTVSTADGSWACHWEHTFAVTRAGVCALTAVDGGAAALQARGIPFAPIDC